MGSERSIHGRVPRSSATHGQQHRMDDGTGERLSRSTVRCNGRRATHAGEGAEQRNFANRLASEGGKEVITIEPADPEVVYVPYYDPEYIYGPPVYPYYPDHYPGYYPGMGLIWAAIILGPRVAHWGNCDWGHGDINIDINNKFNRNQVNPLGNRGPGNR